jgi:predicted DNA-binding transcriptional regulator AlpA
MIREPQNAIPAGCVTSSLDMIHDSRYIGNNSNTECSIYARSRSKNEPRPTLNNNEVAEMFGITRVTLYRWLKDGKIPEPMTHPVTKQKIWTQSDLDAVSRFIERQRRGSDD